MSVRLGWAIVEVMGHRRYVGEIEEATLAGAPVLRVYVPEHTVERVDAEWRGSARWTRPLRVSYPAEVVDLGGGALFAVTRVTEEDARREVARTYRATDGVESYGEWAPPASAPALPGPVEDATEVVRCAMSGCTDPAEPGLSLCERHWDDASDAHDGKDLDDYPDGELVTRQDEGADDLDDASELGGDA